jgi:hypothetical protein
MKSCKSHSVVLAKAVKRERSSSMLLARVTAFPCKGTFLPYRDTGGPIVDSGKKWIPAFAV